MSVTRKARVPMPEQIRLINECRLSGLTDTDWCCENGIAVSSTFYNWVSRCRKAALERRPNPNMTDEQLAELAPWSEKLQAIKKNRM